MKVKQVTDRLVIKETTESNVIQLELTDRNVTHKLRINKPDVEKLCKELLAWFKLKKEVVDEISR